MSEKELIPLEINLHSGKEKELDESWLRMFGGAIETIFGRMFGLNNTPISIRGTKSEIDTFSKLLGGEKNI